MKTIQEISREQAELHIDRGEIGNFTTDELQDILHSAITKFAAELQAENALFKSALIEIHNLSSQTCRSFEDQSFDATRIAREALTSK